MTDLQERLPEIREHPRQQDRRSAMYLLPWLLFPRHAEYPNQKPWHEQARTVLGREVVKGLTCRNTGLSVRRGDHWLIDPREATIIETTGAAPRSTSARRLTKLAELFYREEFVRRLYKKITNPENPEETALDPAGKDSRIPDGLQDEIENFNNCRFYVMRYHRARVRARIAWFILAVSGLFGAGGIGSMVTAAPGPSPVAPKIIYNDSPGAADCRREVLGEPLSPEDREKAIDDCDRPEDPAGVKEYCGDLAQREFGLPSTEEGVDAKQAFEEACMDGS